MRGILFNKVTLQTNLTSSYSHMTLAIFNLRQKVHRCIYTHFDVSKIYKSLKSWSAISLNLNKKLNEWMEWWNKESYLYWIFSIGPMITFLLKIDILGLAITQATWWWRWSQVSSRSVFVFACHVIIMSYVIIMNKNYS